jgi:hypothetical protein
MFSPPLIEKREMLKAGIPEHNKIDELAEGDWSLLASPVAI